MRERVLLLHVGYGKTGSTYFQAIMQQNAQRLAEVGIAYPKRGASPGSPFIEGFRGRHVSGNALTELAQDPMVPLPTQAPMIVLSAEQLFIRLNGARDALVEQLQRFCSVNAITRVRCLVFIRDPIDRLISGRAQIVGKAHSRRASAYIDDRDRFRAGSVLQTPLDLPGFGFEVFNYSRHKTRLKALYADILGVPGDFLSEPDGLDTNRSLRAPEYALVAGAAASGWSDAHLLSLALKLNAPDPGGPPHIPALDKQKTRIADQCADIALVNSLVPESERLQIAYRDPQESTGPHVIETQWFTAVGRAFGYMTQNLMRELKANQAQVELLTASRALLLKDRQDATAALARAALHIEALAQQGPDAEAQAAEMSGALAQLRRQADQPE